ncbi:type II secretion system protein [Duganella sp. CT11-25]|uniref:type II secretion system protein n=1 Tax=unclassified Duganella TaxID=2636909 RepID=UPI0039AED0BF
MRMPSLQRRAVKGFSLLELLASAVILGLLATVAVPFVETAVRREKEHDLRVALRSLRQAIDAYKEASASGRIPLGEGQSGYPPELTALTEGVTDLAHPGGPPLYFLRRIPRDPFSPDSTIAAIDTWRKRSFASDAEHPKEGDDVFDVYSGSTQMGLNGVRYNEW